MIPTVMAVNMSKSDLGLIESIWVKIDYKNLPKDELLNRFLLSFQKLKKQRNLKTKEIKFFVASFGDFCFQNAFGLFSNKLYFSAEHAEMSADTKLGRDGAFPVQLQDSVHELDKVFVLDSLDHACAPAEILDRVVRVSDERDNFVIKICVVLLDLFDVVKNCVNKGLIVRGLLG